MPNILINPNSGIIEFATGVAGGSSFISNVNFTGGSSYSARLSHDGFGGLNIVSFTTGSGIAYSGIERFSIDGNNGRLFSITDNLSGSLFSVNDIAGLPIIEAFDNNTVVMGAFNRNDFVLTGNSLGLGGLPNTGTTKLYVSGNVTVSGNIINSGIADIFPASSTKRRYYPEGIGTTLTFQPIYRSIQYFPFLIKKDAINPKICVEVTSAVTNNTPIRYGIYSGNNGFEGAKLFHSGSINCLNVAGVYTGDINTTLVKGPYIIATSNTGESGGPSVFRSFGLNTIRCFFGEPTGFPTLSLSTAHYHETGIDLLATIGSGLITSAVQGPGPVIIY